ADGTGFRSPWGASANPGEIIVAIVVSDCNKPRRTLDSAPPCQPPDDSAIMPDRGETMTRRCPAAITLALATAVALPVTATASTDPKATDAPAAPIERPWTTNFYLENDLFGATDQNYTNGIRLSFVSPNLSSYRDDPAVPALVNRINERLDKLLDFRDALTRNLLHPPPPVLRLPHPLFLPGCPVGAVVGKSHQRAARQTARLPRRPDPQPGGEPRPADVPPRRPRAPRTDRRRPPLRRLPLPRVRPSRPHRRPPRLGGSHPPSGGPRWLRRRGPGRHPRAAPR